MDEKVRGYLFRLLKNKCDDHPARLLLWLRGDDFAQKVFDLYQNGEEINNQSVLDAMKDIRGKRNIEWKQHGKHCCMSPDDMRKSIRQLEKAIAANDQGFQSEYNSTSAI